LPACQTRLPPTGEGLSPSPSKGGATLFLINSSSRRQQLAPVTSRPALCYQLFADPAIARERAALLTQKRTAHFACHDVFRVVPGR
jgi:hypothetical protein